MVQFLKVISSTQKISTHVTQAMLQKTIYTNLIIEQIPVNKQYMQWQQTYGRNYLPTLNTFKTTYGFKKKKKTS